MCYRGYAIREGEPSRVVYVVEPAGGENFQVWVDQAGEEAFRELVSFYNLATPPVPAGWPPPRLGREGLPAEGAVLWWNTIEWTWLHAGSIGPGDRWLPAPPSPPVAP
jgi:hypothetical protein